MFIDQMKKPQCATAVFAVAKIARSRSAHALFLFTVASACHGSSGTAGDAAPPHFGPSSAESARTKDDLWHRASDGDASDLGRLADREGAAGLLEGLEEGGTIGQTALLALPFADDAEASYARLGEILSHIDSGESAPFIAAIGEIARRPSRQREVVDPPGLRACAQTLLVFAQRTALSRELRAPAISALRLLAERHGVDRGAIPTDLDPK
jgi:hypothetical protein